MLLISCGDIGMSVVILWQEGAFIKRFWLCDDQYSDLQHFGSYVRCSVSSLLCSKAVAVGSFHSGAWSVFVFIDLLTYCHCVIRTGQKRPGVDQSLVHWVSSGLLPTLFNGHIRALQWGSGVCVV